MKRKTNPEYGNFAHMLDSLLKVTHREIKAKLEEERRAKKRKKSKTSSASREAAARD